MSNLQISTTSAPSSLYDIEIALSESLYHQLTQVATQSAQDVSVVVQFALEYYFQHYNGLTPHTWDLCGAFAVAEPESTYQEVDSVTQQTITHYADHVDDVLYGHLQ